MSSALSALAESRIQEAVENGEFGQLSNNGQPIDLDAYFAVPASLRAAYGFLKSAGVPPPEIEAFRVVTQLRAQLERTTDPKVREALSNELQTRETEIAMAMERMNRLRKADAGL